MSGLVVANRLSENPDMTVLVLEAGRLDNYEDIITYPIDDGSGLGTKYDWNLWTTPQTFLNNLSRPYDMGRGIGGGSLINGMCCEFCTQENPTIIKTFTESLARDKRKFSRLRCLGYAGEPGLGME